MSDVKFTSLTNKLSSRTSVLPNPLLLYGKNDSYVKQDLMLLFVCCIWLFDEILELSFLLNINLSISDVYTFVSDYYREGNNPN